jgi:hypothetical protein
MGPSRPNSWTAKKEYRIQTHGSGFWNLDPSRNILRPF